MLADTLGSVSVIISSLLIYFFDLAIFDAICSLFIAILIFVVVHPLLTSTSKILLLQTPVKCSNVLHTNFENILSDVPGIIGFRLPHFFECEPQRIIGTLHLQIAEDSEFDENDSGNEDRSQRILIQVTNKILQRFRMSDKDLCVQIERKSFLDNIDPVHHSVYNEILPIPTHSKIKKQSQNKENDHKHMHGHDHSDGKCNHVHHTHEHLSITDVSDETESVQSAGSSSFVLMPKMQI